MNIASCIVNGFIECIRAQLSDMVRGVIREASGVACYSFDVCKYVMSTKLIDLPAYLHNIQRISVCLVRTPHKWLRILHTGGCADYHNAYGVNVLKQFNGFKLRKCDIYLCTSSSTYSHT